MGQAAGLGMASVLVVQGSLSWVLLRQEGSQPRAGLSRQKGVGMELQGGEPH